MKTSRLWRLAAAGLFFLTTFVGRAQWFDQGPVFSITEENDAIGDTDRHYTQGFKMAYLHTDNHAPDWLMKCVDAIPTWGFSSHAVKIGTEIGQNIYTPQNIKTAAVVTDDRPYAGWLYTGFILQRHGLTAGERPVLESFQVDIGIVGPESLAEEAQEWTHTSTRPQGWDNQLDTELGVALKYMRAWVISPQHAERIFDFVPHAGFSLGNIDTSFRIGGTVRLGINLPDDFGPQTINSLATTEGGLSGGHSGHWGFYVYGGVEGSAVAYNEFLDGDAFRDDVHHVTHEPLVAEMKCGIALVTPRAEIGTAFVWRTDEFTQQNEMDFYGSLFVKVKL